MPEAIKVKRLDCKINVPPEIERIIGIVILLAQKSALDAGKTPRASGGG